MPDGVKAENLEEIMSKLDQYPELDRIRRSYDLRDMVPNVKGSGHSKWAVCPLPQHPHKSNTPSLSIFFRGDRQYFKCHGACGLQGDVIDFVGYSFVPGYKRWDMKLYLKAAEILTGGKFKVNPPDAPPPAPPLPNWLWQEMYPPSKEAIEYALSRGLTLKEIEKFRLGTPTDKMRDEPYLIHSPQTWLAIPTFHNEELIGVKLRSIIKRRVRFLNLPGSKKGLFNYNDVFLKTEPVLVLKGEIPVMVAHRHGLLACAPTGGEISLVDGIRSALALSYPVVVGDNDPDPGVRKKMVKAAEVRAATLGADLRFPPERYKDFDEWLLAEPEAIHVITRWMEEVKS